MQYYPIKNNDNDNKDEFFVYKPKFNKKKTNKDNKKLSENNPFNQLSKIKFT